MKWNSLYQITAASENAWPGGYRPQIHVLSVLSPQMSLLNLLQTKFLSMPLWVTNTANTKDHYIPFS